MKMFPINLFRSRLTTVLLVLAMGAYVPACCCWTEAATEWALGGSGAIHDCGDGEGDGCLACGHHGREGTAQPGHHDHGPNPGHEQDCSCGAQHRVAVWGEIRVPVPSGEVIAWLDPAGEDWGAALRVRRGGECRREAPVCGLRTLLRLHCALMV